jgi:hypothetical protein
VVKKIAFGFATLTLALASAAPRYNVTFFERAVIHGAELKPGDYKMDVQDGKVVFSKGKMTAETPAKVENGEEKYATTAVRYGENAHLREIRIGGTKTKLVFED